MMKGVVFTIGHSTQPLARFIGLLKQHRITVLADVRSKPYSRMNPQFNRVNLMMALKKNGIAYVFLGKELGARSTDRSCYENGKVQYSRLARTELFEAGLARVREGSKQHCIALMCAEKEPLECHRTILVSRYLTDAGMDVWHILWDGRTENHADSISRLIRELHLPESDMFMSRHDVIAEAYRLQGARIAFSQATSPDDLNAIQSVAR